METLNQDHRFNAPALFNERPHHSRSGKYNVIPTSRILKELENAGFHATRANQARSVKPENRLFARHVVRLRHNAAPQIGDSIPELVLVNAHNGTSSYKLMLGIFRIVCANGMITGQQFSALTIRHSGHASADIERVITASRRVIDQAGQLNDTVQRWHDTAIDRGRLLDFATQARELVFKDRAAAPDPRHLVLVRRSADYDISNFWTAFNVIQENITKGGIAYRAENNRWRRTRAIRSVDRDVKTNTALWDLADQFQKNALT